jgi:hypothetical protein
VFCGGRPVSAEDVYPKWVSRLLGIEGPVTYLRGGQVVRHSDKVSVVAKVVCNTCNNGWMSDLEVRMQRTFASAVLGGRPEVDTEAQRLAATWAVKTALLRILARPTAQRQYDPRASLRDLYERGEPHPDWRVWVARTDAEGKYIAWDRDVGLHGGVGRRAEGAFATVAVGYLVFHVFVWDVGEGSQQTRREALRLLQMPDAFRPFMTQVWPVTHDPATVPEGYFRNEHLNLLYEPTL